MEAYWGEALPPLPGVVITDKIQIARGGRRPSGLWITCSEGAKIRLALNTRLPVEVHARNGTHASIRASLSISAKNSRTPQAIRESTVLAFSEATWRRDDENDVVITPPLSKQEADILSAAFLPTTPARVRWDFFETGTEMPGVVDGNLISAFLEHCLFAPKP